MHIVYLMLYGVGWVQVGHRATNGEVDGRDQDGEPNLIMWTEAARPRRGTQSDSHASLLML